MAQRVPGMPANTAVNTGGKIPVTPYVRKDYVGWDDAKVNTRLGQVALELKRPGANTRNLSIEQDDLNRYRNYALAPPAANPPPLTLDNSSDRAGQTTRYREAANRIKNLQPGAPEYDNNANILKDIGGRFGYNWQNDLPKGYTPPAPAVEPPPPTVEPTPPVVDAPPPVVDSPPPTGGGSTVDPTTTPPPTSTQADLSNYQSPMTKALLESLGQGMNSMRAYEPQYFEGSPLYKFQKEQGQKDLAKLMAARGLTGSGAEIQGYSDFLGKIGAEESEKQRQYAEGQMTRNNDALRFIADFDARDRENLRSQGNLDADRLQRYQFDQAGQAQQDKQGMLNFFQNILGQQAQGSPMTAALNALGSQNDASSTLGKAMQQFLSNRFTKAVPTGGSSGGGGGGSGGGAPSVTTVPPADTSSLDIMRLLTQFGNQAGNNDVASTGISNILGLFK